MKSICKVIAIIAICYLMFALGHHAGYVAGWQDCLLDVGVTGGV